MALLLAGCPRGEVGGDPTTLRLIEDGAPSSLDPRRASDAWAIRLFDALLRHVVAIGPDGRPAPDLALAWRFASPTRLRLDLDPAASFEDGTAITAGTVAGGLRALADPAHGGIHGAALAGILAMEVVDRHRLDLVLRAPDPGLVQRLHLPILHPRDATAPRIDRPRSSGPYRLAGRPDPDTLRIEATSTAPAGAPRTVLVRAMPDALARGLALEAGEADLALNAVAAEDLASLAELPHLAIDRHPGWNVSYLAFRTDRPPFDDPRIRRAIGLALPRAAAVRHLLHGTARVHDGLLPPPLWAASRRTAAPADPAAATGLLDAAGLVDPDGPGGQPRLRVTWTTSTNPERLRIVQAMAGALEAIGIEVEIRTLEFGTLMQRLQQGELEMWSLTWVGVHDPDLLRHALHGMATPPAGANRGRHADPELDRLLDAAARAATDPTVWAAVEARIAETTPVVPLWAHDAVVVRARRVGGYIPRPDGGYRAFADIRWVAP